MKKLRMIFAWICVAFGLVISLGTSFLNSEETQTQLIINHWAEYLIAILIILLGVVLAYDKLRGEK